MTCRLGRRSDKTAAVPGHEPRPDTPPATVDLAASGRGDDADGRLNGLERMGVHARIVVASHDRIDMEGHALAV